MANKYYVRARTKFVEFTTLTSRMQSSDPTKSPRDNKGEELQAFASPLAFVAQQRDGRAKLWPKEETIKEESLRQSFSFNLPRVFDRVRIESNCLKPK